jgi:hypothetical protein
MALGKDPGGGQQGDDADGHINKENPAPPRPLGEHAAQKEPDGSAPSRDGAPDGKGAIACCAFRKRDEQDGEGGGRDDGAAQSLDTARDLQHEGGLRQATDQRSTREEREPGHENDAATEKIRGPSPEEEEAGKDQRVGIDDPLQIHLREVQGGLDGRERNVDHHGVHDDHQLNQRHHGENRGAPTVGGGGLRYV